MACLVVPWSLFPAGTLESRSPLSLRYRRPAQAVPGFDTPAWAGGGARAEEKPGSVRRQEPGFLHQHPVRLLVLAQPVVELGAVHARLPEGALLHEVLPL